MELTLEDLERKVDKIQRLLDLLIECHLIVDDAHEQLIVGLHAQLVG